MIELDFLFSDLMYELIGRFVVIIFLLLLSISIIIFSIIIALTVWIRGWTKLSGRMYKGYDANPKENRPPLWRMRIAAVSLALARFKIMKIPEAYCECKSLAHDKTTFIQHVKQYFNNNFKYLN